MRSPRWRLADVGCFAGLVLLALVAIIQVGRELWHGYSTNSARIAAERQAGAATHLRESLLLVCAGTGLGASTEDDSSGDDFAIRIPEWEERWRERRFYSEHATRTKFVICDSQRVRAELERCHYYPGLTVIRQRTQTAYLLREARTAMVLDSIVFDDTEPQDCRSEVSRSKRDTIWYFRGKSAASESTILAWAKNARRVK